MCLSKKQRLQAEEWLNDNPRNRATPMLLPGAPHDGNASTAGAADGAGPEGGALAGAAGSAAAGGGAMGGGAMGGGAGIAAAGRGSGAGQKRKKVS